MKTKIKILIAFTAVSLSFCACTATNEEATVARFNAAAFEVYGKISAKYDKNANLIYPPLSAINLLGMRYVSTDESGYAKLCGFFSTGKKAVETEICSLNSKYANSSNVTVANRIWMTNPSPKFSDEMKKYFSAEVTNETFEKSQLLKDEINNWVKRVSKNRIETVNVETTGLALLMINAATFAGKWSEMFDAKQTKEGTFTTPKGNVNVSFMNGKIQSARYYLNADFEAAELKYKDGFSMILVLSKSKNLNYNDFQTIRKNLVKGLYKLTIFMPKFKLATRTNYLPLFHDAGIPTPNTQVFSDVSITVDEEGTKADATSVFAVYRSGPMSATMKLDKPFKFFIIDSESGLIHFMGDIVNPLK